MAKKDVNQEQDSLMVQSRNGNCFTPLKIQTIGMLNLQRSKAEVMTHPRQDLPHMSSTICLQLTDVRCQPAALRSQAGLLQIEKDRIFQPQNVYNFTEMSILQ
jgi:hypothetical protein